MGVGTLNYGCVSTRVKRSADARSFRHMLVNASSSSRHPSRTDRGGRNTPTRTAQGERLTCSCGDQARARLGLGRIGVTRRWYRLALRVDSSAAGSGASRGVRVRRIASLGAGGLLRARSGAPLVNAERRITSGRTWAGGGGRATTRGRSIALELCDQQRGRKAKASLGR